ncbi:MAG: hypothetical protein J1G02_06620 [Clostridiales bacterium]|nr:hypothetical protein [Clostridiales bacterium]
MRKKLTYGQKHWLSLIGAYLASVGIPIATCAIVFPVEIVEETHMSIGASLIITAIVSVSVFRNRIKKLFENYTVIMAWAVIFILSILMDQFVYEMKIISLVGLGANIAATPLFKIAETNGELAKAVKSKIAENEINDAAGG